MESVRDFEVIDEDTLDATIRGRNPFRAGLAMICAVHEPPASSPAAG
ncbi:hypothetical protein I6F07_16930 [Ensifer sp. IC4062]|nr:hypothetical protein [Ensifer sp. IC4062]MCA1441871.1 hypothetical protein [Ensifer sp. IC4062]